MIRVFLVDDHAVVRQGLRAFLELQPDMEVVGEVAGGHDAIREVPGQRPDVVLMDLVMPDGDGLSALEQLVGTVPGARVLVLSSFSDDANVSAAMRAGAAGYLLKDIDPQALAAAIRDVNAGRTALHPDVLARLLRQQSAPRASQLTPRELEVLACITQGLANKQIGRELGVTEKTVKTHVSSILDKLSAADRTEAAVIAIRNRLVPDTAGSA
ncbi:MAG: response regulator transcription factor [Candidatus Dormiibacterota bacterium]